MPSPTPSSSAPKNPWPRRAAGLLAALALAVVGLVLALDTLLTNRARAAAAELSATLGRPVQVGRVSVSLLRGLAAEVTGLEVGAGQGEPAPLLQVARVEVKVDLLRALASLGREVPVRSALVEGLAITLLALPDGTTNLERVTKALDEGQAPAPASPEAPADRSAVRVDHLSLVDGRIALRDLRPGAGPPVEVRALTLTLDGLQAGRPLQATLTAAVLAAQPNLEVHLLAGPLPPSLVPVPERLTVKLQPLDLAPLAPFFPRSVGLLGGRLDLDLALAPGAAVPGGTGPTVLKGLAHALGLRFAGAEGGKPLDATLDADLSADVAAGDVTLSRLELALGPARLTGQGTLQGLLGDAPRAQAFSVTGSNLDPELLTASFPGLAALLPGEVAGPVGVVLVASGGAEAPKVSFQVELTPVRLRIPGQLTKAAGTTLRLVGTVQGQGGGKLSFATHADLAGADLRPGGLLDKPPGAPLQLALAGTAHPGAPLEVTVTHYEAQLLDDTLTGAASLRRVAKGGLAVTFSATGRRLDLDRLLLDDDDAPPAPAAAPAPARPSPYAGLGAQVRLELGTLVTGGLAATGVVVEAVLTEGVLAVPRCAFTAAGGGFTLDGSTLTLSDRARPFSAQVKLEHLDVAQGLQLAWPDHRVLEGRFDGTATLAGAQRALAATLTGQLEGTLHDGTFVSLDALGAVLGPLLARLPFMQGLAGGRASDGTTHLGTVPVGLRFKDGTALLKAPIVVRTAEGAVTLAGGVALDGDLRMPVKVELAPALVSRATQGKATLTAPLPVGFLLTGPAWKPQVTELDLVPAAGVILASVAAGAVGHALGGLGGLLGGPAPASGGDADAGVAPSVQDQAGKLLKGLFGR
jgi:AsmA protein